MPRERTDLSDSEKKDFTSIIDLAKDYTPPPNPDNKAPEAFLKEIAIEKVDDFESLDDYAKSNPAPEPVATTEAPEAEVEAAPPAEEVAETPVAEEAPAEIIAAAEAPEPTSPPPAEEDPFAITEQAPEPVVQAETVPAAAIEEDPFAVTATEQGSEVTFSTPAPVEGTTESAIAAPPPPEPVAPPPAAPAPKKPAAKPSALNVPAAFPFSVRIDGALTAHEKEKLTDLLEKENFGPRAAELEPQFEAGKILIPRISEFAAVKIVQILRTTSARIQVGPSDLVFASKSDPASESQATSASPSPVGGESSPHSVAANKAERLPLSSGTQLTGHTGPLQWIDWVSVSAVLESAAVETEQSPAYLQALDALTKQLKYKAFYKKAQAITEFKVELVPLHPGTLYRLTLSGNAVRLGPTSEPAASANAPEDMRS